MTVDQIIALLSSSAELGSAALMFLVTIRALELIKTCLNGSDGDG